MRKQLLVVLLPLLVMIASAETANTTTAATDHNTLQRVQVMRADDGISVEMTAHGPLAPKVSTLDSPARLLITLPNTVAVTSRNHLSVGSDGVKGIRIGTDGQTPPTTSVVIDLLSACNYELSPGADNTVVVKLHPVSAAVPTSRNVTTPQAAKTPASIHRTALQPVSAKPDSLVTGSDTKQEETASAPKDFVFLEPSYNSKPAAEAEPTVTAPPVRAAEAAAKFVERPEGNLLPTPSAAQTAQAPSAGSAIQPAVNLAAEQKAQMTQQTSSPEPKYTGEPISVNLKDVDLKDFFRLIHEISGLNVVLDPNVKGTLTIVLDDVPWDQALDIVLKNNDLARQLDGNILRIATVDTLKHEAEARRAQHEAEALAVDKTTFTRFLSYAHAKDLVSTCKKFISQRGDVIADERTNAIIVTDVPSVIPAIDKLLSQLDRKTQQVEIEARVVAATRSFARDIGTQLGFAFGNNPTGVGGASQVGATPTSVFGSCPGRGCPFYPIIGTGAPTAGAGSTIPLFSNLGVTQPTSGINLTNASAHMRIDAILTMAESRGLVKILSRPRVVTQNNIQALVRQGVRVPIVTQAQLGGPPTVTYVDAFLRLTVIPQITSEGTIFLNVDVENTTPDFGQSIQGNPTLITQQATTQVLVTDGGTVVIGGVIQTNNSVQVNQVPLLGSIPYLGNLFKHTTVSTNNQELIFFITPRIIQT